MIKLNGLSNQKVKQHKDPVMKRNDSPKTEHSKYEKKNPFIIFIEDES